MSLGILGKKLGMSQLFDDEGRAVPVTVIEAGPCRITQLKSADTDGYASVQIGFQLIRENLSISLQKVILQNQEITFCVIFESTELKILVNLNLELQ